MPVGSVGKWLVLGTLVAALGAGGCKEDEEEGTPDTGTRPPDAGAVVDAGGGGTDSGPRDSGPTDTGPAVDSAPAPVKCGAAQTTCTEHLINPALPPTPAGCAKNAADAEVCGISSMTLLMGAEPKFIEKNAPGVDSPSCGAFLDSVEQPLYASVPDGGMGGKGNGVFDTQTTILGVIQVALKYPGCCTPRGYCSVNGGKGMSSASGAAYMPSDNGYGCVESTYMFRSAPANTIQMIPCDPATGMIMMGDGGTDGGSDSGASDAGADGGNS